MARINHRHIFPGSSQYIASPTQMFPVPEFADCGDAFVPRTTLNLRDYYLIYNNPEDESGRWYWLLPWHWNWRWNWPWHWLWHWLLAWQWPWHLNVNPQQVEMIEPYFPERPLDDPEDFLLYDYDDTESEDSDVEESDMEDSGGEDSDEDVAAADEKAASQHRFAKERGELKSFSRGEPGDRRSQEVPCAHEGKKSPGGPKKRAWVDAEEERRITKRVCDNRKHVRDRLQNRLGADAAEVDHGDVVQQ